MVAAAHVLLIRQFRHLPREHSLELPGGGRCPARARRRQPGASCGRGAATARSASPSSRHPWNAYLDETAYRYVGEDLVPDPLAAAAGEFFERCVAPFRDPIVVAPDGRITESVSKVAILAAALGRGGCGRRPAGQ